MDQPGNDLVPQPGHREVDQGAGAQLQRARRERHVRAAPRAHQDHGDRGNDLVRPHQHRRDPRPVGRHAGVEEHQPDALCARVGQHRHPRRRLAAGGRRRHERLLRQPDLHRRAVRPGLGDLGGHGGTDRAAHVPLHRPAAPGRPRALGRAEPGFIAEDRRDLLPPTCSPERGQRSAAPSPRSATTSSSRSRHRTSRVSDGWRWSGPVPSPTR